MAFRVLPHTADAGVEASSPTFPGLLEELASGMFSLMGRVDPGDVTCTVEAEVAAASREDLVVDVLSELVYRAETEDLIFGPVRVEPMGDELEVRVVAGGAPTGSVEAAGPAVKAVTYHGLIVEERRGGWHGRVYFDV